MWLFDTRRAWPRRPSATGSYFLRLFVLFMALVGSMGCDSDSPTEPDLMADFTITGEGPSVVFLDSSPGMPEEWLWEFGDGEQATKRNPSHKYKPEAFPRIYSVTLRVCKSEGSVCDSEIKRVRISDVGSPVFEPVN